MLGTDEHIAKCKLRCIQEAVALTQENMDLGLSVIEKTLEDDRPIIDEILRRHGIAGGAK